MCLMHKNSCTSPPTSEYMSLQSATNMLTDEIYNSTDEFNVILCYSVVTLLE